MNALSKYIPESSNTTLGQIFPIDTYGYPRYIDFILPTNHAFDFQTKQISGFNFLGDVITIKNDASNGNLTWRFMIYEGDDIANRKTWMNHSLITKVGIFIYAIAYY
jgi:hypothetical protein